MGKVIIVNPQDLDTASQKMMELSETYTNISRQLMQNASNMGSAWDGEDNMAFVEQINGFCEELKIMAERLDTAGQALKLQKENYEAIQVNNIQQVKKLVN